jgi:AraC family transcriptional regulator
VTHLQSPAIRQLGHRLAHELRSPDDLTPLEAQALALEMLAAAGRLGQHRSSGVPTWLHRVDVLLHDRFREPLYLEDLAAEAGVHPAHLARVFRRHRGMSPGQYLRRLRLEWAAERLVATAEPVSRIALQAGYADQAHFTRAFSRHWGTPPGRYRTRRS